MGCGDNQVAMARCTACGQENAPHFRFCGSCGRPLPGPRCPGCGFENPAGQRFCGSCGCALGEAVDGAGGRGERRLATVLFADVVGFTGMAERRDPEAVAAQVDAALRRIAKVVVDHGGSVDKYIGDSVMALFGIPAAHGDDADRAVAAALAIRDQGGELRFSIGINSGEVMVTAVGEGGATTAIGDAVNVAARLEESAGAGEVLVGPLTAELVRERFLLHAREPALLRGKREPVEVFEVLGERAAGERDNRNEPPLVDREADLNFLLSCWRRAASHSRCQTVLLTGDAGIGKTRMLSELAAIASDDGLVARSACPGYGSLVGVRLASDLAAALSEEAVGPGPAASLDEQGIARLRLLLGERAGAGPVLLLVDDAHNAARADLEPLAQLAARAAELPVMLVLSGRSQPPEWLGVFGGVTTLRLDPLAAEDTRRLATLISGSSSLGAGSLGKLAAASGGNPLHLRELMRLVEAGESARSSVADSKVGERLPLPPSLKGVLSARLDTLSPADKEALQALAVFSDGARAEEVAAVAGRDVGPGLDRLLRAGLLHQLDGGRNVLADPLLREVAYEQLSHAARGERHRRAATVAETQHGRARHLALAATYIPSDESLRAEAAETLAAAGTSLLEGADFRGGVELLRQAVELGHGKPESLIRLAQAETDLGNAATARTLLERVDTHGDPRLEAAVLQAMAADLHHEPEAALDRIAQATARWQQLGDEEKVAWSFANRANLLFRLGRVDEAGPDAEEALRRFTALGHHEGAAAAGQQISLIKPDDPRVPDLLASGLRLGEERGDLVWMRNALIPLAWVRFVRSQLGGDAATADALADAERLTQVCDDIGDAAFEAHGLGLAALLHRLAGRLEDAEAAVSRARRLRLPSESPSAPFLDAAVFLVSLARGGAAGPRPAPAATPGPLEVVSDALIVEGLLLGGHLESALAHLRSSPLDVDPGVSPVLGRLIGVVRGAVLLFTGSLDEAERSLAASRDAARAVNAAPTGYAATALLAETLLRSGREDEARAMLAGLDEDVGGIAGLLVDRARLLLGDASLEGRVRDRAERLAAPGLLEGETSPLRHSDVSTK
jgi:class 3 adenylate cyclase/tetratricopeptide (TPR) repeat protein